MRYVWGLQNFMESLALLTLRLLRKFEIPATINLSIIIVRQVAVQLQILRTNTSYRPIPVNLSRISRLLLLLPCGCVRLKAGRRTLFGRAELLLSVIVPKHFGI